MKTKLKLLSLAVVAAAVTIIVSCSKEDTAGTQTDNTSATGSNMRTGSLTIEAMTGSCSSSQDGDMTITWGTSSVSVTSRKSGANAVGKFKVSVFDITVDLQTGEFTIPNDGRAYWFVPYDPNASPQRMKAGGGMEVTCNCKGTGTCSLEGQALEGGGSEFSCASSTCNDCCEMVIVETGGGNVCVGSGVLLEADVLIFNNVTYNKTDEFFYLTSQTGTCASPGKTEVYYHKQGENIIFNNLDNSNVSVSQFNTIIFGLTISNGRATIPNDGKTYWYIPFDNTGSPQKLNGGTTIEMTCTCDGGTGNCRGNTTVSGGTTTHTCNEDGCTACCKLSFVIGGTNIMNGGGVVGTGTKVKKNGMTYQ
jgi:hypothetical protein